MGLFLLCLQMHINEKRNSDHIFDKFLFQDIFLFFISQYMQSLDYLEGAFHET